MDFSHQPPVELKPEYSAFCPAHQRRWKPDRRYRAAGNLRSAGDLRWTKSSCEGFCRRGTGATLRGVTFPSRPQRKSVSRITTPGRPSKSDTRTRRILWPSEKKQLRSLYSRAICWRKMCPLFRPSRYRRQNRKNGVANKGVPLLPRGLLHGCYINPSTNVRYSVYGERVVETLC